MRERWVNIDWLELLFLSTSPRQSEKFPVPVFISFTYRIILYTVYNQSINDFYISLFLFSDRLKKGVVHTRAGYFQNLKKLPLFQRMNERTVWEGQCVASRCEQVEQVNGWTFSKWREKEGVVDSWIVNHTQRKTPPTKYNINLKHTHHK